MVSYVDDSYCTIVRWRGFIREIQYICEQTISLTLHLVDISRVDGTHEHIYGDVLCTHDGDGEILVQSACIHIFIN